MEPGPRPQSSLGAGTSPLADAAALWPAPVERSGLLALMLAAPEPVISVIGPPGYGKSTLLSQWARRRGSHVAWVSCAQLADDAPVSLWASLSAALVPHVAPPTADEAQDAHRLVDHLVRARGGNPEPVTIVLDQLDALRAPESRRAVGAFAASVPLDWKLALASRTELPFGEARMKVDHRLLEIGTNDLAMSLAEARRLLDGAGVDASETVTRRLLERTEGWPAALYLAALAARGGESQEAGGFTGTDRLMSDYLRSEVIEPLTPAERDLLVRTSILERLSGPLCDAVTGDTSGARLLAGLKRRHVLVSLDRRGEHFRCHHLLRELLEADLRSEHPDLVPELHLRAAAWCAANDEPARAIDHAYLSGDPQEFGRLALEGMQQVWADGRIDTVLDWMERLGRRSPAPHTPAMIAHGALIFALLGRAGDAERWADVAESLPLAGILPDGGTVGGTVAYLRANLCRNGPAAMRQDSLDALAGLGPTSPYRATMHLTEGVSYFLEGDLERADAALAHAYDLATSIDTAPLAGLVLAEQFQVATERGDWTSAESLIKRSLETVSLGPYDDYWTSALPFASAARAAAHRGDMAEAREYAHRAARLRPLLTAALPVGSVQALVELARAYLALVDPAGAVAVLEQARGIVQQRPDLGTLAAAVHVLDERVSQITAATPVGASSLTEAELRLVPLLPTHLTYPEMGERLFISRHTVKSHASSVYRKLGASSRAEAVERMRTLGLL
jgi:LuxR family maltose regulon positive regulatory protein